MENEKVFTDGIIFKLPKDTQPEFVKGLISFKVDEAIAWIRNNASNGWCNIDLLVSKGGKPYSVLNTYKPKDAGNSGEDYSPKTDPKHAGNFEDDIPF
jgi:hypothetical protein